MGEFEKLLGDAKAGDTVALTSLMSQFNVDVRAECFDIQLFEGNDLSGSDLQQEAWFRVWSKLYQFEGISDSDVCRAMFRKWIRQTARRVMINLVEARRAQKRHPGKPIRPLEANYNDDNENQIAENQDRNETPSRIVSDREEANRVRAAINQLDDEIDRQIIKLSFLEGFPLKKVSELMDMNYDRVRYRLTVALKKLEELIS